MSHEDSRRRFLSYFSAIGLSSTLFPGALWASIQGRGRRPEGSRDEPGGTGPRNDAGEDLEITVEDVRHAERIAGLEFTDEEREFMLDGLRAQRSRYAQVRDVPLENSVPPAVQYRVPPPRSAADDAKKAPGSAVRPGVDGRKDVRESSTAAPQPEDLAFASIDTLGALLRSGRVSSVELTRLSLERLAKYDPTLHCVVTLTAERALAQAEAADEELRAGKDRGPLHGIPWGAKDLLATKRYPTTWGAKAFEDQTIDEDAAVVRRLDTAGAVLVAKLSLGSLAMGDVWFRETTRNPWDPSRGSSGSSAGPGAAVAAGLVPFAIGSETNGSIVSPSTVCGVSGLRPTFGRVSRAGAMALSWSMDKLGPMARSARDCALVFDAIHGADSADPTTQEAPFESAARVDLSTLRVGFVASAFRGRRDSAWAKNDAAVLEVLRSLGAKLVEIELPDDPPPRALSTILTVEAAAAFDDLTRSNRDDLLVRQSKHAWPNLFRQARMVPAVEYLRANRVRTRLVEVMERTFDEVDLYVCPSYGAQNLIRTNLTGHPTVVVPNGFSTPTRPTSITLTGRFWDESTLLAVASLYQGATGFHRRRPPL